MLVRLDEVSARMALLRDQASAMDARVGGVGGLHGSALAALGLAPSHAGDRWASMASLVASDRNKDATLCSTHPPIVVLLKMEYAAVHAACYAS